MPCTVDGWRLRQLLAQVGKVLALDFGGMEKQVCQEAHYRIFYLDFFHYGKARAALWKRSEKTGPAPGEPAVFHAECITAERFFLCDGKQRFGAAFGDLAKMGFVQDFNVGQITAPAKIPVICYQVPNRAAVGRKNFGRGSGFHSWSPPVKKAAEF